MGEKRGGAAVIPFGKHKGLTVAEVLERDADYARWLAGQGWLAERFAELHAALMNRGAAPEETPEHNALQARFLDVPFTLAVLLRCGLPQCAHRDAGKYAASVAQRMFASTPLFEGEGRWGQRYPDNIEVEDALKWQADFEAWYIARYGNWAPEVRFEVKGADVHLELPWAMRDYSVPRGRDDLGPESLRIELKPSMGDDFPSVMRQMQRARVYNLLVQEYTGIGVPLGAVARMFAANACRLLILSDVEAMLPLATRLVRAHPETQETEGAA